jgi:hypothetical protein
MWEEKDDSYYGPNTIGEHATPPLFEGRWRRYWWPPKKGRAIGELLEQRNCLISHNMTVLWGCSYKGTGFSYAYPSPYFPSTKRHLSPLLTMVITQQLMALCVVCTGLSLITCLLPSREHHLALQGTTKMQFLILFGCSYITGCELRIGLQGMAGLTGRDISARPLHPWQPCLRTLPILCELGMPFPIG